MNGSATGMDGRKVKLYVRKVQGGVLVPDNDETAEWLQKVKNGEALAAEITRPRNYKFFKKMFALARVCFDYFVEQYDTGLEYKGMKAQPSFERFRKDMTILAGHYDATYDINGRVRLEAKSWSWANCSEEEQQQIYSDFINVALKKVFRMSVSEEQLRKMVDDILAFA
jgi:hypothetical protein